MLVLHGVSISIGSTIYIKDAGTGAYGCNFEDVVVISDFCHNERFKSHSGLGNENHGFFVVKLSDKSIWKINPPNKESFIFKDKNVVELI